MQYAVIFIDWDGTLSNSRFWGHWATDRTLAADYELIQRDFFAASPQLLHSWMRGALAYEEVMEIIASKTGIDAGQLLTELEASCRAMQFLHADTLSLLRRLRSQGIKVVLATDNMDTFPEITVPALKLHDHFDAVLDSHTLKALKRDKRPDGSSAFFGDFFAKHKIEPTRTLLIDDGLHNQVVEDFGIHYTRVTPEQSAQRIMQSLLVNGWLSERSQER